ncbi:collagen alpha-1(XXV) chain-like [Pelobates fuscus]|uniref:collagen alpha-1(XXV) chain-like n=1 Tax=Pelobates fuscus TaxID=191477 RepID=UPI002FE498D1
MMVKSENKTMVGTYQRCNGETPRDGPSSWGRTLPNVLAFVLSVLSLAFCLYLNIKSNDLHGRIWAVEHGKSGDLSFHVPGLSVDQLNSIVQEKVDQLLSQRSYEHMAKIRISREAPAECNCPAGPPGQRGKRGRRGEPGKYH